MKEKTSVLFVRNVPQRLIQRAKAAAALSGEKLYQWIIRAVEKSLQ